MLVIVWNIGNQLGSPVIHDMCCRGELQDPVNLLKDIFIAISNIDVRCTNNGSESMCNAQTINIGWLAFWRNIQMFWQNSAETISAETISAATICFLLKLFLLKLFLFYWKYCNSALTLKRGKSILRNILMDIEGGQFSSSTHR